MRRFSAALSLFCLFALVAAPAFCGEGGEKEGRDATQGAPLPGAGVEGRVIAAGKALEGAFVYVYANFEDFIAHRPAKVSRSTDGDGKYKIDLSPGSYYLVAKKTGAGPKDANPVAGDYFSFQGSNPVRVADGRYARVGFNAVKIERDPLYEKGESEAEGAILGTVLNEGGQPLEGAHVSLYVDTKEDFRGMTYAASPQTGKDGIFSFENLPEMDYFVIARKRSSGKGAGPLGEGDYFGFYPLNPLPVRAGKAVKIEVKAVGKAGEIRMEEGLYRDTGTRITGRVTDREGNPAQGVYVFGYLEKVMGHNRPESISDLVDKDGRYVLNLKGGNTYYIGARSLYGDTPALGEWYGRWEGTGDHSVVVETGKVLENIDITVEKILP